MYVSRLRNDEFLRVLSADTRFEPNKKHKKYVAKKVFVKKNLKNGTFITRAAGGELQKICQVMPSAHHTIFLFSVAWPKKVHVRPPSDG
jgi:hypothetical protein